MNIYYRIQKNNKTKQIENLQQKLETLKKMKNNIYCNSKQKKLEKQINRIHKCIENQISKETIQMIKCGKHLYFDLQDLSLKTLNRIYHTSQYEQQYIQKYGNTFIGGIEILPKANKINTYLNKSKYYTRIKNEIYEHLQLRNNSFAIDFSDEKDILRAMDKVKEYQFEKQISTKQALLGQNIYSCNVKNILNNNVKQQYGVRQIKNRKQNFSKINKQELSKTKNYLIKTSRIYCQNQFNRNQNCFKEKYKHKALNKISNKKKCYDIQSVKNYIQQNKQQFKIRIRKVQLKLIQKSPDTIRDKLMSQFNILHRQ